MTTFITINVPVVYMARYVYGFEAGKIHYKEHWKGWVLEIETFLGRIIHRLNMELDIQSLFGLLCTAVIIG